MKNFISLFLILSMGLSLPGQDNNSDIQKEIDQQVWEVFKKSYSARDAELFNSIHTDDVLRLSPNSIRIGNEYKDQMTKSFSRPFEGKINIDFRFQHRVHREEVAYEVGYYRVTRTPKNGEKSEFYGRFHVLIKKQNGVWKIAQDWDSDDINGHQVGKADFDRLSN